ncbi:MAG TPA: SURF1 family cytochrome oxidase biogenesis protein [Microbacteriaceae bacterium]|nr:SURF1 family cytochrome oxidase biogenesis protein [Microbacteriaceae bacterium]
MSSKTQYQGEPTLGQVMRSPKWILALLLALGVAAGFASLAQWQMGTAVKLQQPEIDSETVYPIGEITATQTPLTEDSAARMVSMTVDIVGSDTLAVDDRMNFGEQGAWVVSHAVEQNNNAHLTVALGWLPDIAEAKKFADSFQSVENIKLTGRYMPQESVALPSPGTPTDHLRTLSVGQVINLWEPFEGEAYAGYIVSATPFEGLELIESVPPLPQETINWLNLFYAVEWVVFAGFAVFFWYRLARDAWEKEHELQALTREAQ